MHISNEQFVVKEVNLPEDVKIISLGFSNTFAVSVSNKIYSWINDVNLGVELVPYLVKFPENFKENIIDIKSENNVTLVLLESK